MAMLEHARQNHPADSLQEEPESDWSLVERHREIHRFTRSMIAFRRAHPGLRREEFYSGEDLRWFNPEGATPNWLDPGEKTLGFLIYGHGESDIVSYSTRDQRRSPSRCLQRGRVRCGTSPWTPDNRLPGISMKQDRSRC
jgi:hypothetical protein